MTIRDEGGEAWNRRRLQTRMTLLGAAHAVVSEKGFRQADLDEIAERAGMTRDAIDASFGGKEELFLAVMRARGLRLRPVYPKRPTCLQVMTALGEACAEVLTDARAHSALIADFHHYVLTHPEMGRRVAEDYAERFARRARELVDQLPPEELPLHPAVLVVVIQSLALGLLMQHLLTPERVTPELAIAAFEAMAGG